MASKDKVLWPGAFENQLSALAGKHIMGIAPQVLQEDVASLISQLSL